MLAEYAAAADDRFWPVHAALMERGPDFAAGDLDGGRAGRHRLHHVAVHAGRAFPSAEYEAVKIAIFAASLIAGGLGTAILWPKAEPGEGPA